MWLVTGGDLQAADHLDLRADGTVMQSLQPSIGAGACSGAGKR